MKRRRRRIRSRNNKYHYGPLCSALFWACTALIITRRCARNLRPTMTLIEAKLNSSIKTITTLCRVAERSNHFKPRDPIKMFRGEILINFVQLKYFNLSVGVGCSLCVARSFRSLSDAFFLYQASIKLPKKLI